MQRGNFNSGAYEHHLMDDFDPYHAFVGLLPRFVDLARDAAARRAVSYRQFHVGAALYAGNDTFSDVATIDGANTKVRAEEPKRCAEMSVLDQVKALGFSRVLGMVIAGTSDRDEIKAVNGRATPTLHPCAECRAQMADSGLFEDSSLIVTVSTESDVYQVHNYGELQDYWQRDELQTTTRSSSNTILINGPGASWPTAATSRKAPTVSPTSWLNLSSA